MISFDTDLIGRWVADQLKFNYAPGSCTAIGRIKDGQVVAGVIYEDFNGANVVCHIAGVGRWMNRKFLSIMFDYPFNQLKAKRITVCVVETNKASLRFVEHLGFELEAILRQAHPDGDLRLYKMPREKCRWLKELPYELT